jgi:hypothetical protein
MDNLSPEQIDLLASEDEGPKVIAIVSALTVLSFVFVVLRFFTRIKFTSQLGSEDYLIAVSMVCSQQYRHNEVGLTFMEALRDCDGHFTNLTSTAWGWKTSSLCAAPVNDRESEGTSTFPQHCCHANHPTQFLYWTLLANVTAFTLIKVSICMQYRRIFSVTDARIPIYVVMAICIAGGISAFFTFAFTCIPVDAFWNVLDRPTSTCINENVYVPFQL